MLSESCEIFVYLLSSCKFNCANPVCGFYIMEQVRLGAVWPMSNWLGSSFNHIQGWMNVREPYSPALEQGPLQMTAIRNDDSAE